MSKRHKRPSYINVLLTKNSKWPKSLKNRMSIRSKRLYDIKDYTTKKTIWPKRLYDLKA